MQINNHIFMLKDLLGGKILTEVYIYLNMKLLSTVLRLSFTLFCEDVIVWWIIIIK